MATLDAAHIASRAYLRATEAGRVTRIKQRQLSFLKDFIHMQSGQRHFSGRYEIKILFMILVKIIGKFRQLTCAEDGGCFDHKGKILFRVALSYVQIKHEAYQVAL